MKRLNLAALSLAVALGACYPAGSQESAELAATTETFVAAYNAGDIDALMELYADDAWLLPPNFPMLQGREAVASMFSGMFADGLQLELQTLEAITGADIGYKIGTHKLMAPDGSVVDAGKFIEVWKQVGGEWKIVRDIFNSDMPLPNMLITHNVVNADRWLAAWRGPDSRKTMFAENGAPSVRVFRSMQDPNLTALLIGVTDIDALQALLESPEGAAAKAEDGVIDASMRVFSEVQ